MEFLQNFVAFSEYINFTNWQLLLFVNRHLQNTCYHQKSNNSFFLFFQFMVSTKLMEILVKSFLPFSHRHSLLEMGQIQFHPGVLLWNLGQPFTFDLGRFFV